MAISYSGSFAAANNKVAGTSLLFTSTKNIPSGSLAIIFVGIDNPGTGNNTNFITSVTDNGAAYNFLQGNGFNNTVRTIATQSDGKILVGGDFSAYDGQFINYIARLHTNGILDTSFTPPQNINGPVFKIIIQPNETGSILTNGVFSVGPSPNISRVSDGGGATGDSQNAALLAGGSTGSGALSCTEEFNGSTWINGGSMINARGNPSLTGTQNAALAGGFDSIVNRFTEEYDGTTWAAGGLTIGDNIRGGIGGTVNAAVAQISYSPTNIQEYDGTSWTAANPMSTLRNSSIVGTQNAALAPGGIQDATTLAVTATEEYNGTTWAGGGSLPISTYNNLSVGIQNNALTIGGQNEFSVQRTNSSLYNGTVWTTDSTIIGSGIGGSNQGSGTSNLALFVNGDKFLAGSCTVLEYNATNVCLDTSEKIIAAGSFTGGAARMDLNGNIDVSFNCGSAFNNTVCTVIIQDVTEYTASINNIWTAGGAMITARHALAGAGTQNATVAFGGNIVNTTGRCTEEYDGTTWSSSNNLINGLFYPGGAGTQNAALAFGGSSGSFILSCTEEYDGTTWIAGGSMGNASACLAGAGTQNAALAFGGQSGSLLSCTEEYDGTTWTAGGSLNTARCTLAGAGTQNAALAFGGICTISPTIVTPFTEIYDGTTWTFADSLNNARWALAGAGTQNAALAFGGASGPILSCTEQYNGTVWEGSLPLINTKYLTAGGTGTQNCALSFGGLSGTSLSCTEEYGTFQNTYTTKIIFGGLFTSYSGSTSNGIARINGNGTLDTSFNTGAGFSTADVRNYQFYSSSTCLLAVGNFTSYSGSARNRIALLNATNGTLIPTSSFNIGAGFNSAVNDLAVQSDNKIVAVGAFTTYSGSNVNRIARINTTGLIDSGSTFNTGAGLNNTGSVVKYYTSGSTDVILIGGIFTTYSGSTQSGSVRILPSGSRDTDFNIGSGFGTTIGANDYLIRPDGKIIAIGGFTRYSSSFTPFPNRIIQLNPNGSVDANRIGGTWSKVREYSSNDAAAAGSTLAMFYLTSSGYVPIGTSFTASLTSSVVAKAASGLIFNTDRAAIVYTGSVTSSAAGGTSQPIRINLANLTSGSGNYLFIRGIAFENADNQVTLTPTSQYSTDVTSNAGTQGGTAATNQSVRVEYRILTTSSYFSNPTSSVAASNASIFWTFYETVIAARGRTYYILLD